MLLPFLSAAFAAKPPASEADVDALLRQLIAEDSKARIAAANALAATPPELVRHLDAAAISDCATRVSERDLDDAPDECLRWNHAMYHYIRVVGSLARQSVDPSTPLGAYCVPRSQPGPSGDNDEPACPLGAPLHWMVHDQFDAPDWIEADATHGGKPIELDEALSGATFEKAAREAWVAMFQPDMPDVTALERYSPYSAEKGGTRFAVVPICDGAVGFYEKCAFHLFAVADGGGRFGRTVLMPGTTLEAEPDPGTPYTNLRMVETVHIEVSEDGRYGMFVTDYADGDDRNRRIDVYDLSGAPKPHCHLEHGLVLPAGEPVIPVRMPEITDQGCRL